MQIQNFELRPAAPADAELLYMLIQEMAVIEHVSDQLSTNPDKIRATLCVQNPASALIGYFNGKPVAYVTYYQNYSTYRGERVLHIDHLYIKPIYQRLGLGKSIMTEMCRLALDKKCARMDWHCLNSNRNAIEFYLHLKAEHITNREYFRMDFLEMERFTEEAEEV